MVIVSASDDSRRSFVGLGIHALAPRARRGVAGRVVAVEVDADSAGEHAPVLPPHVVGGEHAVVTVRVPHRRDPDLVAVDGRRDARVHAVARRQPIGRVERDHRRGDLAGVLIGHDHHRGLVLVHRDAVGNLQGVEVTPFRGRRRVIGDGEVDHPGNRRIRGRDLVEARDDAVEVPVAGLRNDRRAADDDAGQAAPLKLAPVVTRDHDVDCRVCGIRPHHVVAAQLERLLQHTGIRGLQADADGGLVGDPLVRADRRGKGGKHQENGGGERAGDHERPPGLAGDAAQPSRLVPASGGRRSPG